MHTSAAPLFVAGHVQRYVIKSESNSMNLYKYRSLDGWKFIFDILLHKRLYAARYKDLNDPMEGYYTFASGKNVSSAYSEEISSAKNEWRLCSLSSEYRSTLMWSYYGGGHSGIAIGISKPRKKPNVLIERVRYDNTVSLSGDPNYSPSDAAIEILSQKLYSWHHEKEYRIFSRDEFIKVSIREVLLGCKIANDDEALIRKFVEGLRPEIEIRKLRRSELIADYGH